MVAHEEEVDSTEGRGWERISIKSYNKMWAILLQVVKVDA